MWKFITIDYSVIPLSSLWTRQSNMSSTSEHPLLEALREINARTNTQRLQQELGAVADSLALQPLALAAALLQLDIATFARCQASMLGSEKLAVRPPPPAAPKRASVAEDKSKMVRYRLEIGHSHQVSQEELKTVLIL
jgi:hypothetical protein